MEHKNKKKKKRKIRIHIVLPILVAIIIFFVIFNYIVIPPKVSKNAEKYRFSPFNIAGLESITVDDNRIVYKFSSISRSFTMIGVLSGKTSINGFYRTEDEYRPYDEKNIDSVNKVYFAITSKYIVLNRNGQEKMEGLKLMKDKSGMYILGIDQPTILYNKYDYDENVKYATFQEYENNEWTTQDKYSDSIFELE